MPLNGSGTMVPAGSTVYPAVTTTTISSTDFNALMADVVTALSTAVYKDGQSTPTANIPMGGFKLTGLAAGSSAGNSLRYEQVFNNQGTVVSASTVNLDTSGAWYQQITGTTTITAITLANGELKAVEFAGILTLTNGASLILPGGANITTAAGDTAIFAGEASSVVRCLMYLRATGSTPAKQPTRQVLTSGTAATYTTPAGATRINIRMVGGGGGGAAQTSNAGANGTDTTFGTLTAAKGLLGSVGSVGGVGGAGTNGDINISGGSGTGGGTAASSASPQGGTGGVSAFGGGGGAGQANSAGVAAATNSGSGGGGAGGNSGVGNSGGGGGAGGYVEKLITSPSTTYTYTVGAGGAGGAAGTQAGGNGAAGIIIVDEYYN